MLIARVRHTVCFVKITTGLRKMVANVISWSSPVVKVYRILPPPRIDMDEAIAVMFTGPRAPTVDDYRRTPLIVNLKYIREALHWLILNHADYADVKFSEEHLAQYGLEDLPLSIICLPASDGTQTVNPATFDVADQDGADEGECPFIVHGICGDDLKSLSATEMKVAALRYFNRGGKVLAIGRSDHPQSIFRNEQLYPQMFPWLFPYGYGGVGSLQGVSDTKHKQYLMMYHDKQFQVDPAFPFVAFSHEQIKTATTKAFLATRRSHFDDISDRFMRLDKTVLTSVIERLRDDGHIIAANNAEQDCYDVINDLEIVTGHMHGSSTSKKWMRNEIWSLVYHCGSPIWYVTLSPADNMHPICLYYAGNKFDFDNALLPPNDRLRLISKNPAACARFFHFMVQTFIHEVLGFDAQHKGIYGQVQAYYGTVEQQGRLTLHLHSVLWMVNGLSPAEMRLHIIDKSSSFQRSLVRWLEDSHMGGFIDSSFDDVQARLAENEEDVLYRNPVVSLPDKPPPVCIEDRDNCLKCQRLQTWWGYFRERVNDVLFRSNIHSCERLTNKDGSSSKKKMYKGCMDNKFKKCKARFPRETRESTLVDPDTGSILMKHHYEWMNTVNAILTFIFGCNTDVTCLLSGTAVKAVLVYVSDYITKSALKTYVMFECIRAVLDNNSELLRSGCVDDTEKTRMLMTKMANQLSAQMELGSPMICMYLLGNPDRYTAHHFETFFWKSFVNEVRSAWKVEDPKVLDERVSLMEKDGKLTVVSATLDYVHRPKQLEELCLFDFVRWCKREKRIGSIDSVEVEAAVDCDFRDVEIGGEETGDHNERGDSKRSKPRKCVNVFDFLPDHPLSKSHVCRRLREDNIKIRQNRIVVNFVGGTPPRRDGTDTEYYYCTMLTFFWPWRSGKDLRLDEETWESAFHRRSFRDEFIRIMNNFHLRYECLDSRDDFRAQMASGVQNVLPPFIDVLNEDDSQGSDRERQPVEPRSERDAIVDLLCEPDRKERENRIAASLMTELLAAIGWSTPVIKNIEAMISDVDSIPRLTSKQWADVVKAEREKAIEHRRGKLPQKGKPDSNYAFVFNGVRVIDKSFFDKTFRSDELRAVRDKISVDFSLNKEQNHAFAMVADHSFRQDKTQMNLYIGGMGGTGKSQVLRALRSFFAASDESNRIMVVAPTGNAASHVCGTTYHYAFGLHMADNAGTLTTIQERLRGVDYIFFDEISMCSSHDLYKISSKLCRISGKRDVVFGGFNMIFAGDFAQLPPPIGGEAVSLYSDSLRRFGGSKISQEQMIGQVAWHMVTDVVILRENMRQKTQSKDDARFRTALENMRYKACTTDDVLFLKSMSSNAVQNVADFDWDAFKGSSIITGLNSNRDTINDIGVRRFAIEHGRNLVTFYSEDTCKDKEDDPVRTKKRARKSARKNSPDVFGIEVQKILWNQPPASNTKRLPGKLMLCQGLPVMLKHNFATELGMVNGQKGTVYGWHETVGSFGQRVLEVLFITLDCPAESVRIQGLPVNVVPIVKTSNETDIRTPSGHTFTINRQQVEISYDFAMTDYASQGYTRNVNPVNLMDLRSHQGYYTALSRSSTAKGTLIVQGFNVNMLTGGCSSALKREFRELEILDEITRRRFEGDLPQQVVGPGRRQLIDQFLKTVRRGFIPTGLHSSLAWSNRDPLIPKSHKDVEAKWLIVNDNNASHLMTRNDSIAYVVAQGSNDVQFVPSATSRTRESSDITMLEAVDNVNRLKRKRMSREVSGTSVPSPDNPPTGILWNANSCAYDSVIVILYNAWRFHFGRNMGLCDNPIMGNIVSLFRRVDEGKCDLSLVRHKLMVWLNELQPNQFVPGRFASEIDIVLLLLKSVHTVVESRMVCPQGHVVATSRNAAKHDSLFFSVAQNIQSTQDIIPKPSQQTKSRCACNSNLLHKHTFLNKPPFVAFDLGSTNVAHINRFIILEDATASVKYDLVGLTYFGRAHFTARFVDQTGSVWKQDGLLRGGRFAKELAPNLHVSDDRIVNMAMYAKSEQIYA
ncbi:ATP-dependent DNA helicase [Pleurotus pulmonarius]